MTDNITSLAARAHEELSHHTVTVESTMPPEIALTRRLMAAPSDEALMEQLRGLLPSQGRNLW